MSIQSLSYKDTGYFSKLICDYLEENERLKSFYHRFPAIQSFEAQINEKQKNFPVRTRRLLAKRIMYQYGDNSLSQSTLSNIGLLKEVTTFTVTTGHQLNIFTGPLYFLYKIFSVINICEDLRKEYPGFHFVPVYWMATEDHDFEEINHFFFKKQRIEWKRETSGAVGELDTAGMASLAASLKKAFGESENGKKLTALFFDAYVKNKNLADATRYLANQLFRTYGLVIIDGNDSELKNCFSPYMKEDLTRQLSHHIISRTTQNLVSKGYPEQVHPREINLFYLKNNLRERIVLEDHIFRVLNTDIRFTEAEILEELQNYPEHFSPNALLRPLYQEVILPNLCYIGGGGELAYWFQLKDYFDAVGVTFPMLLLRNSALLISEKWAKKMQKLDVSPEELFLPENELRSKRAKELSPIPIDFSPQKDFLQKQFTDLYKIAEQTDKSFLGAVKAQEKKQLNGLDKLERRLLKAQKRKFLDEIERVIQIQEELFPNQSLQERMDNFSEYYLEYGHDFFERLKDKLNPLEMNFKIFFL